MIFVISINFFSCLQVIAAEGEQKASRALREASDVIADTPAALQLRYLQVLKNIYSAVHYIRKSPHFHHNILFRHSPIGRKCREWNMPSHRDCHSSDFFPRWNRERERESNLGIQRGKKVLSTGKWESLGLLCVSLCRLWTRRPLFSFRSLFCSCVYAFAAAL